MIWLIWKFLSNWASEMSALTWLTVAFVAAVLEVSIPHFGSAFVSAGALAAAVAAYLGFSAATQLITFVIVLSVSLVGLRSGLMARIAGRGVPSRTDPLVGRLGVVTHDIEPATGAGRVNVGGEDWAARSAEPVASGTTIRVVGADGIVLEVTRA
ncbi:MAG: NfeD family protein [Acidobacteria bacterium]|nr:NfeD family protein [Acidobacteriota bacterium]